MGCWGLSTHKLQVSSLGHRHWYFFKASRCFQWIGGLESEYSSSQSPIHATPSRSFLNKVWPEHSFGKIFHSFRCPQAKAQALHGTQGLPQFVLSLFALMTLMERLWPRPILRLYICYPIRFWPILGEGGLVQCPHLQNGNIPRKAFRTVAGM